MGSTPTALERCVGDASHFAESTWGRLPLLHRGGRPFDDVLDLDDVDAIVSSSTRRPAIRLVRDGVTVDPRDYSSSPRLGGRTVHDVADPDRVHAQFAGGATIVLQSLHRTNPKVATFASALEEELSHPVQANAYLTPPGSKGLAPHADGHDVLVMQLRGTKHWRVEGLGEITLEPNSTIYLPRGTEHEAATVDESSLHLTLGILRVTYRAAVRRILDADDDQLDAPLPLGYARRHADPAPLEAGIRAAVTSARERLTAAEADDIARRERTRRRPRRPRRGRLTSLVELDHLDTASVVGLRLGVVPQVELVGDRVHVRLDRCVVRMPPTVMPALDLLCRGQCVVVGDLPGLDAASQVVVARRLVVEGMLDIATSTAPSPQGHLSGHLIDRDLRSTHP